MVLAEKTIDNVHKLVCRHVRLIAQHSNRQFGNIGHSLCKTYLFRWFSSITEFPLLKALGYSLWNSAVSRINSLEYRPVCYLS